MGGKAADTALWREHLHAATMAGRVAAARVAVELGYAIEPDPGPSGRLGHWKIAGISDEVMELHSKRAAEIEAECQRRGDSSYRARGVAARATRKAKHHEPEGNLMSRWRAELAAAGWPAERLATSVDAARRGREDPKPLSVRDARALLGEVLGDDGDLARRKVFSRRHVIVAVAPHLFGQPPEVLEKLVDRALADPEVVPLVGVAGARETVHSLASVLAREAAVAEGLGHQLARSDAPTVPLQTVTEAIKKTEQEVGAGLSQEQRAAVVAICTSGRGAELVVGVAGAGKTTMLRAVAEAFERAGHEVTGTATSGQAARNLGHEAGIDQSRTLASLIWRLDHGQLGLTEKSVVVLDEVGMTGDAHLARVATYAELAGAKLVLTGDHRQLPAVGPGGALAALVKRHPDAVHHLGENRRQHDPGERQALESLRDGDVADAVSWYVGHGRVHAVPTREDAFQATVDAWAADVGAGHETGLYAWRRANVAELNRRARAWMEATGRLTGPELVSPGGTNYRAGDRVVTLAPNPEGSLVTSERATVQAIDLAGGSLVLRTDNGRQVRLRTEHLGPDRLGYGYATTVHRSQGSTTTRAHLFGDGGGRELAYVAMSRAREYTHAWVVADDVGQAADDLRRDWAARRTPTWALDTGLPWGAQAIRERGPGLPMSDRARVVAIALAQAEASRHAVRGLQRPGRAAELGEARAALARAEQGLFDLQAGDGAYSGTEAGRAVSDLARAGAALSRAKWTAQHSPRWRERRAAIKESAAMAAQLDYAEARCQAYVAPQVARLEAAIYIARQNVESLVASQENEAARWRRLAVRGQALGRAADRFTPGLAGYRDGLDAGKSHSLRQGRRPVRPTPSVPRTYAQPSDGLDLGPGL